MLLDRPDSTLSVLYNGGLSPISKSNYKIFFIISPPKLRPKSGPLDGFEKSVSHDKE